MGGGMKGMKKRGWLLLAIGLSDGPVSPVQLQKTLFLFKKRLPQQFIPKDFYKFLPYNYGPFCLDIYSDATQLELNGLIEIIEGGNIRQYVITPTGRAKVKEVSGTLPALVRSRAKNIVRWVRAQSFRGLISAIYQQYPSYMANSIFRG